MAHEEAVLTGESRFGTLYLIDFRLETSRGAAVVRSGWIVRTEDGTVLQRQQALPTEFSITGGPSGGVVFPGTVVGTTAATLTVCRKTPVGHEERVVTISGTGAAYVTTTSTGTCS